MNIKCQFSTPCINPDDPYANFTSEGPDQEIFIGQSWGWDWNLPPIGSSWQSWSCYGVCESTVSQDAADQCARNNQLLCLIDGGNPGGRSPWYGTPPVIPLWNSGTTTNPEQPVREFYSAACVGQAKCADGSFYEFTVPYGYVVALSQPMANRIACSLAASLARKYQVCLSDLPDRFCVNEDVFEELSATGRDRPYTFTVVSGSLPPGISLLTLDDHTVALIGTLSTAGTYTFTIRATSSQGNFKDKSYTIEVAEITTASPLPDGNVGTAYSTTLAASAQLVAPLIWTLQTGSLPAGLTLNSATGEISGTPTAAGTQIFTIEVEDSNGASCQKVFELEIISVPCPDWTTTLWPLPALGSSGAGSSDFTPSLAAGNNFTGFALAPDPPGGDSAFAQSISGTIAGYAGAACNCNLHLIVGKSGGAVGTITIIINFVAVLTVNLTLYGPGITTTDYPFTIPDSGGVPYDIHVDVQIQAPLTGGPGVCSIDIDGTLTNVP